MKALRRRLARLMQAMNQQQGQTDTSSDDVAPWAQLFAFAHDRGGEPSEDDWAAAADFVADCVARGVEPTWIELVKLAGED